MSYCVSAPWTNEHIPLFLLYDNGDVIYRSSLDQAILDAEYRRARLTEDERKQLEGLVAFDWQSHYTARGMSDIGSLILDIGGPHSVSISGVFGTREQDEESARSECARKSAAKQENQCIVEKLQSYPPENLKQLIRRVVAFQHPNSEPWTPPCWNIWLRVLDDSGVKTRCPALREEWRKMFPGLSEAKKGDALSVVVPAAFYRAIRELSSRESKLKNQLPCLSDGDKLILVEWRHRFPRERISTCLEDR